MVFTALYQASIPVIIFDTLEKKAYSNYYNGKLAKGSYLFNERTREHFTIDVINWEKIMYVFAAVWGPMFLIGFFNLSEVLKGIGSFYIEHVISNMLFPANIFADILLYQVAVFTDEISMKWILAGSVLSSFITYFTQVGAGADAQYYLKLSKYDDGVLLPSIFYAFGWFYHDLRVVN